MRFGKGIDIYTDVNIDEVIRLLPENINCVETIDKLIEKLNERKKELTETPSRYKYDEDIYMEVSVDSDDCLNEINDEELFNELKSRGYCISESVYNYDMNHMEAYFRDVLHTNLWAYTDEEICKMFFKECGRI